MVVEGDVWLNPSDYLKAAQHLGLSLDEFAEKYTEERRGSWVRLRSVPQEGGAEACIFLNDQNQCSIYEARPLQCITYPFWPRIVQSKEAWNAEAVMPDDREGKHWNPKDGGCEGIEHEEAEVVPFEVIRRSLYLQTDYYSDFPF